MFTASASATQIEVQPSQYSFDMMAGDSYSQELQVTWNGDNPTALTASTDIAAESTGPEGFNISYSDNPVAFLPGETRTVQVGIDSSEALKTDDYTFTTEFSTSVTVDDDESDTEYYYTTTVEGDLNKSKEEELREKVNETVDQNLKLQKELEALRERLQQLNSTDDIDRPAVNQTQEDQTQNETTQLDPDNEEQETSLVGLIVELILGWLS